MMAARFPVSYRDLAVGDCVPAGKDGRPALFAPGPARWYALTVRPQREDQAEAWLALRGVYAFHPVLMRQVRVKGSTRSYARRYVPGYVFARFPGVALAHHVEACPDITGAITMSDNAWGVLEPAELRRLHAMRKIDVAIDDQRRAEARRKRALAALRNGDRALFRSGPLAGTYCEVVGLKADGGAVVRLSLFGGDRLLRTDALDLVSLRGRG